MADQKLLSEIAADHKLKHAETVDKSAPAIDANVQVKKFDKNPLLNEIASEHSLKHAETVDKSAPAIGSDVHVKTVDRKGLLSDIQKAGSQ